MAKIPRMDARNRLLYRPERRPKERKPKLPPPDAYVPTVIARNGVAKTGAMALVELALGMPIEEALEGSLSVVAKRTGMDASTVSKWKLKLGLR